MAAPGWQDVDQWRQRQYDLFVSRFCELAKLGWILLASNDGKFWARRWRPADAELETFFYEGEPELREHTYELLLVAVKLRNGRKAGAA